MNHDGKSRSIDGPGIGRVIRNQRPPVIRGVISAIGAIATCAFIVGDYSFFPRFWMIGLVVAVMWLGPYVIYLVVPSNLTTSLNLGVTLVISTVALLGLFGTTEQGLNLFWGHVILYVVVFGGLLMGRKPGDIPGSG